MSSQASDHRSWSRAQDDKNHPKPLQILSSHQPTIPSQIPPSSQPKHIPHHHEQMLHPQQSLNHLTPLLISHKDSKLSSTINHSTTQNHDHQNHNDEQNPSQHIVSSLHLPQHQLPSNIQQKQHHYSPILHDRQPQDQQQPSSHHHHQSKYSLTPLQQEQKREQQQQQRQMHQQHDNSISKDISNDRITDFKYHSQNNIPIAPTVTLPIPPPSQPPSDYPNTSVSAGVARKRQFRFSVHDDIKLLELVIKLNPYGAAYGCRIHKWQAIADDLRKSDINIDFRRARDRTNLLLEQWREQDFSLIRRSGSGNHEDQQKKEQLLERTLNLEQASRPRDSPVDWHFREQGIKRERERANHLVQPIAQASDKSLKPNTLSTFSPVEAKQTLSKMDARSSQQTQLPPLGQNRDIPFPSHFHPKSTNPMVNQPSAKYIKSDDGFRINRYQDLFASLPVPSNQLSLNAQPLERRTSTDVERPSFNNDGAIYRPNQQYRKNNQATPVGSSLDPIVGPSVSTSPAVGESQNIQLSPDTVFPTTSNVPELIAELVKRIGHLEQKVSTLHTSVEKLSEESRAVWEAKKETERRNTELAKLITKAYEDRNLEREESRRREEAFRIERERLFGLLSQNDSRSSKERERNPD